MTEASKAIDNLLASRLKKLKPESKDVVEVKRESEADMRAQQESRILSALAAIPEREWWDEAVYSNPESITHLIEHPVPLRGTTAMAKQSALMKAIITPAERYKLRKLKKQEKVRDVQDKIKMGLLKPPPPKIKMKNLMLVLGKEAVAGPSAVEQSVKAQVEQRLRDHERRNEERKLPAEQRREKNIAKWTRPLEQACVLKVSAFLIFKKVSNKSKFKINRNAEQLHLGGFFLNSCLRMDSSPDSAFYPSLVVAEGSRKAVKRFDRLMLHRIDWNESGEDLTKADVDMTGEEAEEDDDEDEEGVEKVAGGGVCVRVFHGSESTKKLVKWTYSDMREISSVTSFLQERGCAHFWDMVTRYRSSQLDV